MNTDCLKLTVYFGESDRVDGRLLSDELVDLFERNEVRVAVLLRAVEGFGVKHRLRSDRLLTLSEDLPLVAVAVDERSRIELLLATVAELVAGGLITLERVRLLDDDPGPTGLPGELDEDSKLTVYLGRNERVEGRPAYLAVVEHLRRSGLAGATVMLGVDGMTHHRRQRGRFFSRNADVPLMVIGVGRGDAVRDALGGLSELLSDSTATLERVHVCKRDGLLLAEPRHLPDQDDAGLGVWQKLMVYVSEQARHGGHPLYGQLIRRLRELDAGGATAVRGIWGFSDDREPHGDRLLAIHRNVPVVTTVVDTPDRIQQWFAVIDELTNETGLVTSELVPALLAIAPAARIGGLRLGRLRS